MVNFFVDNGPIILILFAVITLVILYALKKSGSKSPAQKINDSVWLTPPDFNYQRDEHTHIAYRQFGQGKNILFIHGIGANTYCWRLLAPLFDTNKYRLTLVDLPGFGYSSKNQYLTYSLDEQSQNLASLCEELQLTKPVLVGSSMGGTICLNMSRLYPDNFKKVIALAPATGKELIPPGLRKIKNVSFTFNWVLNRTFMAMMLKQVFSKKELVTDQSIDGYLNPYLYNKTESVRAFVKSAQLIMDPRLPYLFQEIKIKPLIIASQKDKSVPTKSIDKLLQQLPQKEFHLHPTAGHHIMEDEPEWVYSLINKYI